MTLEGKAATSPISTNASRLRGADLLVESLLASGVTDMFGVPGDTGLVLYDALYFRAGRLRHVLARDERHAATMADAYARVTNRVGVVEVSSGGGTTFVVGGLGESFAASVPVLLITSDIHVSSRNSGALTEIDQVALFSGVTKWQRVVEHAREIPAAIREALTAATTGRPAPVAVIVPENVLDESVTSVDCDLSDFRLSDTQLPRKRPLGDPAVVAQAAFVLAQAKQPAIIAGSGVHASAAWAELASLAEKAGIAVATTIHGKGAIADTNPWSLGIVGNNGAREYANRYVLEADAVLLVGTRANATDTNSWTGPSRRGAPVIQIDIDADRAGRNFPEALRIVADARAALKQVFDAIVCTPDAERERRRRKVAAERTKWEDFSPAGRSTVADGQILPRDAVRIINEVLGSHTVVIADPGTPTPNVASYWETTNAGRTVIVPRGHGPMGYAIPAAIGAALARPGEPVVSLTADGSFAMACGELETVTRLRAPILYVQFTNHSFGWIKMLQHLYTGQRYFGVDPGPIDAVRVAQACGVPGEQVRDLDRFRALVEDFAAHPAPLYIELDVPHVIDYTPPVPAWLRSLDGTSDRPVY
jgi:acetolactate synthase-1/2/3 large subunit